MAETATLQDAVGHQRPVFLRKLRRKADWGRPETPPAQRADELVIRMWKCEPHPNSPFSVFRVENDEEFHRVAVGMNGGREHLDGDSTFVALLPSDLDAVGVEARRTQGVTKCRLTNALHHDIRAETEQLLVLCRRLIDEDRGVIHLSRRMMTPIVEKARADHCLVFADSPRCGIEQCDRSSSRPDATGHPEFRPS